MSELVGWLTVLAADDDGTPQSRRARDEACVAVYRILDAWVPSLVRRNAPCRLSDDDALDILQHVVDKAALGSARFRGHTEGEARQWVKRIVANKAIDLCRRAPTLAPPSSSSGAGRRELAAAPEEKVDEAALRAAFDAIEETMVRTHRRNDAETLVRAFRCHMEARLGGASIEDQIDRYGYQGTYANEARDDAGRSRARNRVYQYRKRGREAGCAALGALAAEGRYGEDDARGIGTLVGCKGAKEKRGGGDAPS
jgi:DNA-directed RNA polymerase specialized sigma24 family protein